MNHRSEPEVLLRWYVREVLREGPAGAGVTADPTTGVAGGARSYDLERGVDIYGYWYKSPGDKGSGDPGRPDDPAEYIGMTSGTDEGGGASEPAAE